MKLNAEFAHSALAAADCHVPLSGSQDQRDIFCFEQLRSVAQDWTVRHENRFYQLLRAKQRLSQLTSKVMVRKWLDSSTHILHRGRRLEFLEFDHRRRGRRAIV